jgi:pSer/pThr/pTyr-binding forkhead associated (FHA) protein
MAGIPATEHFEIHITGDYQAIYHIESLSNTGYIIGRSDEQKQHAPDIDLSDYDGLKKGVSRRHAVLVRYEGFAQIIDLHSSNGTFLNGERLQPDNPYPLAQGDELRFGSLLVQVVLAC